MWTGPAQLVTLHSNMVSVFHTVVEGSVPKFSRRSFLAGFAVTGAASQLPALAPTTAWQDFCPRTAPWQSVPIDGHVVLKPLDEATFVSTNAGSQYVLATTRCRALVGDHLP